MLHLERKLPPPHSGPVWLLGIFSVQPLAQSHLSPRLGGQGPSLSVCIHCSLGQSFILTPEGKLGSRVATVPSLPCPSHHLWLQIRSDWGQWVLLDITDSGGTEELWVWGGTGGRTWSFPPHTCKHMPETHRTYWGCGFEMGRKLICFFP